MVSSSVMLEHQQQQQQQQRQQEVLLAPDSTQKFSTRSSSPKHTGHTSLSTIKTSSLGSSSSDTLFDSSFSSAGILDASLSNNNLGEESTNLRDGSGGKLEHSSRQNGSKKKKKKKDKKKKKSSSRVKEQQHKQSSLTATSEGGVGKSGIFSDDKQIKLSSDLETSWENGNRWGHEDDWDKAPFNSGTTTTMQGMEVPALKSDHPSPRAADESFSGGFSPRPPTSQGFSLSRDTSPLRSSPLSLHNTPPATAEFGGYSTNAPAGSTKRSQVDDDGDGFGIISNIQSFVDENVSVLTDNDHHNLSIASTKFASSAKRSHRRNSSNNPSGGSIRRISGISGISGSSGDSEQVPHDLLVNYMLAMGANRENAEELAQGFTSEQQRHQQLYPTVAAGSSPPRSAGRHVRPAAVTLSSKLRDAERGHGASFQREYSGGDEVSEASFSITDQSAPAQVTNIASSFSMSDRDVPAYGANTASLRNTDPYSSAQHGGSATYNSPTHMDSISNIAAILPNASKMVEARPVGDIESDLPVVFGDSAPASFKFLLHERPVRRLLCLALLVVLGLVVAIVVYFTVFQESGSGPRSTDVPSMSPSLAPTFITEEILEAAAKLSSWNVLADTTSPQLKAVSWMSAFDQVDTGGYGSQEFAQRYALIVLYFSLHDEAWINEEQWLTPDLHECEWSSGIFCLHDATETLIVTGVDMTRNNLYGTVPQEIGILSSLVTFRIPMNFVGGTIPDAFGQLASMAVVDVSENALTGAIPASLEGARDLILVDLSKNQLASTIPDELYNLSVLRTLVLKSNQLSGTISESLTNLTSLVTLDVRHNMITGTLPFTLLDSIETLDVVLLDNNMFTGPLPAVSMDLLKKQTLSLCHNQFSGSLMYHSDSALSVNVSDYRLQYVDVSYNELSGSISPLFGFMPSFRYFDLSGNDFEGPFPSKVGWDKIEFLGVADNALTGTIPIGYPSMTHLDASNNQFTQGIPEALCDMVDLEFIVLSGNQLEGTVPGCLADLPRLRDLELRDCSLTGLITPELGQSPDLAILNLADNLLVGTIPSELGDLMTLQRLKLQGNSLTGSIPSEVANLMDLKILNLTDNALTGTFPAELGGLIDLESLFLRGNSDLGGKIPGGLCGLSTLELSARDIGCDVVCDCCSDAGTLC